MPMGIHPSFEPHWAAPTRFGRMTGSDTAFYQNVILGDVIRADFTARMCLLPLEEMAS